MQAWLLVVWKLTASIHISWVICPSTCRLNIQLALLNLLNPSRRCHLHLKVNLRLQASSFGVEEIMRIIIDNLLYKSHPRIPCNYTTISIWVRRSPPPFLENLNLLLLKSIPLRSTGSPPIDAGIRTGLRARKNKKFTLLLQYVTYVFISN